MAAWTGAGRAKDTIPDHYRGEGIEPWDIWESFHLDPWSACAVKYILRAGRKGPPVDDYRKAQHYLQYLIEREESYEEAAEEALEPKVDCAQCGAPPERFCADGCVCSDCEPEPPTNEAPEGPLREAQKIAREMADPEYVDPPRRGLDVADPNMSLEEDPSSGKLRWYLDRFHNGGRR